MKFLHALLCCLTLASPALSQPTTPLATVDHVDLPRYMGTWYEIAAIPQRFERGCTATQANYSLRSDGKVDVVNSCYLDSPNGKLKRAKGIAKVVDTTSNAKLKVSFFWPFYGDYWIIDLGENYEYAVVGHPDRTYLWILARTPSMSAELYHSLLEKLHTYFAYDTRLIVPTRQN